jgi:hypothetical protein
MTLAVHRRWALLFPEPLVGATCFKTTTRTRSCPYPEPDFCVSQEVRSVRALLSPLLVPGGQPDPLKDFPGACGFWNQ